MGDFRHYDDKFYINGHEFDIKILETFDPQYNIPSGCSRHYIQDKKHFISNGRNQVSAPFPWDKGDEYIKSIREFMYLKQQIELDEKA
jgi:hypothetical protein